MFIEMIMIREDNVTVRIAMVHDRVTMRYVDRLWVLCEGTPFQNYPRKNDFKKQKSLWNQSITHVEN